MKIAGAHIYWWSNPKHRGTRVFSFRWRADMGMGVRCTWLDIGPLEIRKVKR